MFRTHSAQESPSSQKNVIQTFAQCGRIGRRGLNVLLVVEEDDVREAENVLRQLSETVGIFVREVKTTKKKLATKMYVFLRPILYLGAFVLCYCHNISNAYNEYDLH